MIVIIDYEAGNLTSVKRALDFLGQESIISKDDSRIAVAEKVIFPGVGAAGSAMTDLKRLKLDRALRESYEAGTPILGICLGTQIVMEWSQENDTACLGLIKGKSLRFPDDVKDDEGRKLKIPHMGWNRLVLKEEHPIFAEIEYDSEFYFVHSYYPSPEFPRNVLGETQYGIRFASVLASNNLVAVQFHPEKSGRPGLKILENFCRWEGRSC